MSKIISVELVERHVGLFIVISSLVGKCELCVMPNKQFAVDFWKDRVHLLQILCWQLKKWRIYYSCWAARQEECCPNFHMVKEEMRSSVSCKGNWVCLKESCLFSSLICNMTELELGRLSTTMAKLLLISARLQFGFVYPYLWLRSQVQKPDADRVVWFFSPRSYYL